MPFADKAWRFSRDEIESLNPNQKGCYGLFQLKQDGTRAWVYIGKGDIRARLLDHLNGDNVCINQYWPTHWVGTVTTDYDAEEKRLIRQYNPHCNKQVG